MPAFIAAAGPSGAVLLRADIGVYNNRRSITLTKGGDRNGPVTVMGVDGAGKSRKAEIVGVRAEPWARGAEDGSEVFRLLAGANHMTFKHLSFRNQGNGCFRIASDIQDLTIEGVEAFNVQRFIENTASDRVPSASVDGLTVRQVRVHGYSKGAIRLRYDSRNILVEDALGDSDRQDGDNFAMGIALQGTVHDVVIRRVTMRNSHDTLNSYWNGDGFSTERGTYNIRFEDTVASGSTDAGYDLKSTNTVLTRAEARDNKRNFRFWSSSVTTVQECVSRAPKKRGGSGSQDHVWVAKGAGVHMVECKIVDSDPTTTAFKVESRGVLVVENSHTALDPAARISRVHKSGSLRIYP